MSGLLELTGEHAIVKAVEYALEAVDALYGALDDIEILHLADEVVEHSNLVFIEYGQDILASDLIAPVNRQLRQLDEQRSVSVAADRIDDRGLEVFLPDDAGGIDDAAYRIAQVQVIVRIRFECCVADLLEQCRVAAGVVAQHVDGGRVRRDTGTLERRGEEPVRVFALYQRGFKDVEGPIEAGLGLDEFSPSFGKAGHHQMERERWFSEACLIYEAFQPVGEVDTACKTVDIVEDDEHTFSAVSEAFEQAIQLIGKAEGNRAEFIEGCLEADTYAEKADFRDVLAEDLENLFKPWSFLAAASDLIEEPPAGFLDSGDAAQEHMSGEHVQVAFGLAGHECA